MTKNAASAHLQVIQKITYFKAKMFSLCHVLFKPFCSVQKVHLGLLTLMFFTVLGTSVTRMEENQPYTDC
jgi:hypothetical protein